MKLHTFKLIKVVPIIVLIFIFATMNFSRLTRLHLLAIIHSLIYIIFGIKLRQTYASGKIWITTIVIVSILDELYQGILPYRYFDFQDIMCNIVGGLIGGFLLAY